MSKDFDRSLLVTIAMYKITRIERDLRDLRSVVRSLVETKDTKKPAPKKKPRSR